MEISFVCLFFIKKIVSSAGPDTLQLDNLNYPVTEVVNPLQLPTHFSLEIKKQAQS